MSAPHPSSWQPPVTAMDMAIARIDQLTAERDAARKELAAAMDHIVELEDGMEKMARMVEAGLM